tara:strand:- start:23838 stop:24869 length:1032 start_codon:yes stop_codon:yes gene_type:complete
MAKHVFVGVPTGTPANFAFNVSTTFAGGAGLIGIWNPDKGTGGDNLAGTGAGENFVTSTTALAAGMRRFQIAQGTTSGYPYGTGLIEAGAVKRVRAQMHLASVKATTTPVTIVQQNNRVGSFKIVKLAAPVANYNEFESPTGSYDDRVDQIRNYAFSFDATTLATSCANIAAVVNADTGSFVTAAATGTQVTLTAKDDGTSFQVIDTSLLIDPTNGIAMSTWGAALAGTFGFTEGVGNGWQAVAAEKTQQHHRSAFHNRISFAQQPELFASAANTYDVVTITCQHQGNKSAVKDATNDRDQYCIEIYLPSGWTDAGGVMDAMFTGLASGNAAGTIVDLYDNPY